MADKGVLQEFTINFDLDLSNIEKATAEVEKSINSVTQYLPQLESLLNEVTSLGGGVVDTTALDSLIENIKNGAEIATAEVEKITDETFTALTEFMENQGYLWDEKTKQWVVAANTAFDEIEEQAEQTSDTLSDIFSNVRSWFYNLTAGFGAFGFLGNFVDLIQDTFNNDGKNGFFSEQDLKITQEYQKSLSKINDFIIQLQKIVAKFLLPVIATLSGFISKTIDFIIKHHKTILLFVGALAIAFSKILKTQIQILLTQLKIFAPYIAVAAIIAGIVALIEDIYYYFMGWDSVTSELVEKFPLLGTALEIIKPLIMGIFEVIDKIKEFFQNPSFDNFIAIFESIGNTIINQVMKIINIFDEALTEIFTGLKNWIVSVFTDIFKWFSDKLKIVTEPIKNLKNSINGAFDGVKGFFGFGGGNESINNPPVIPAYATNTTRNDTTYNNNMEFTLNGVDERTAKKMSNDISKQINQYQMQVGSKGVK